MAEMITGLVVKDKNSAAVVLLLIRNEWFLRVGSLGLHLLETNP